MPIFDAFKVNEIKAELEQIKAELEQVKAERDSLKQVLSQTERMSILELQSAIAVLEERKKKFVQEAVNMDAALMKRKQALEQQIDELDQQIEAKKKQLIVLDDAILLQSFGFYEPKYDLQSSELYKRKLEEIRDQQQQLIKSGNAIFANTAWTVNNSQREGEKMVKDYVKLILRSFNNECDATILRVKFNNVEAIEKKIRKAFETLNSLGQRMQIIISAEYLNLKLQELYLVYEYQVKKQQEREEQKLIREQMREEAKLLKEIEERKLKFEKEEKHFNNALETIAAQLQKAQTATEQEALQQEALSIQEKLAEVEKEKLDVQMREQNTRAGYVYIISNIGSFGEDVYKIGVTRRLDPQERVDELGDASVPYDFDIHALIFSEDAPALENALHKAFEYGRLNLINRRREFFKVTLDEIEQAVKTNFNKPTEFIRQVDAAEYRQSLALKAH
jgi:hypothetical protein